MSWKKKDGSGEWEERVRIQEEVEKQGTTGTSLACGRKGKGVYEEHATLNSLLLFNRMVHPFIPLLWTHVSPDPLNLGLAT